MRVANFNCENLFARYKFDKNVNPTKEDGFLIDQTAFDIFDDEEKKLTAEAIKEVNADVIALEEVESLRVLDLVNSKYLKNLYDYDVLIDAHDPRKINVAILSKYPIVSERTHRNERSSTGKTWLFSRDCLEVEIDVNGKPLFLYVNHLKSMMEGRDKTKPRRVEQSKRVVEIIDEKWQDKNYEGNFIVLGDLNDYPDKDTGISALLEHPGLENVIERLPADDQWTHYWAEKKEYSQLDYIFLSKSLAKQNSGKPNIMRKGIAKSATKDTNERFKGVGDTKPIASDHAPVYMDIQLG